MARFPVKNWIAAGGIFFLLSTGFASETVLRLTPALEPLPVTGVPFLNEKVTEVYSPSDGLTVNPADGLGWTRTAARESGMTLQVTIDPSAFDHAIMTIWNWHNRPVRQVKLVAGQLHRLTIEVEGGGAYLLTVDGYREGICTHRLIRSVAWTEDLNPARDSWRRDEFLLGVCGFPGRYHWSFRGGPTLPPHLTEEAARELEADLLARLGFQAIRVDESMEMGLRSGEGDGNYLFDFERMDAVVDAYVSRGFELAFQLMNPPDWAIADSYRDEEAQLWTFPRKAVHVQAHAASLLERYGEHVRFVQVYNEPDQVAFWGGTPEEFLTHFDAVDGVRRHLLPNTPVVNGGYSLVDEDRTRFYVEHLKGKIEYPAYHSHGTLEELREDHETIQSMHEAAGYDSPRFLNTEMGFDGWRLDQERRKGQVVPQKTLYCWASGHAGVLLFGGRMTIGPEQVTQDFGFLDFQFCPRFVYGSMAALVSSLAGASFEKTLVDDGETYAYLFRRGEEKIVAAFTLDDEGREIGWESDAGVVMTIDEMGNRTPAGKSGRLMLDGYPRYLLVEDPKNLDLTLAGIE